MPEVCTAPESLQGKVKSFLSFFCFALFSGMSLRVGDACESRIKSIGILQIVNSIMY